MGLTSGDELAGRYVIEDELGAGGMGVVLSARDKKLGRNVAVKVLAAAGLGDDVARDRLIREARAAATLEHPGIVQVYDVGETPDGGAFLVMEFIRGKNVQQLMREGAVDHALALRIISEVAAALASAHAQGLVHRDIKPGNIMVREDGRVVVLDFGLVKSISHPLQDSQTPDEASIEALTRSSAIVGTPVYLAPEQARGNAEPATDQWALGVTAYELLTGRIPWKAESTAFVLAQILMDDPPAASEVCDITPRVDPVLARALSKDPKDRYENIEAFGEALVAALGETATSDPRGGASRRRIGLSLGAAMIVTVAVALGSLDWGSSPTEIVAPDEPLTSTLADPSSVFACAVFEAEGVEEPAGWLGAAASVAFCRRMAILLGGDEERMLTAAHLLDLPPLPTTDFPTDPYGAPDARSRTLAAAEERATTWIDGTVRRLEDDTWELDVRIETTAGVVDEATSAGDTLGETAEAALRELIASGAVPAADRLIPEVRETSLLDDPEDLLLLEAEDRLFSILHSSEYCTRLFAELPAVHAAHVAHVCTRYVEVPDAPAIEIDRTTPFTLAMTAVARVRQTGEGALVLADEVSRARRAETRPRQNAILLIAEGNLRFLGGQVNEARPLMLSSSEQLPLDAEPRGAESDPEARQRSRLAMRAWRPDLAEGWFTPWGASASLDERLSVNQRGHQLVPHSPRHALELANVLLDAGRLDEMRSLAARLRVHPESELAGLMIDALVDRRRGRFEAAQRKLHTALSAATRPFGVIYTGDTRAFGALLRLGELTGRAREVADDLVREYLLGDTNVLRRRGFFHELFLIRACALASPEVADAGLEAIERLRADESTGQDRHPGVDAFRDGARAHAHGDMQAVVAAWRPLTTNTLRVYLIPGAFDAGGAPEIGRHLDAEHLESEVYGGAHPAQRREALRCLQEGNDRCARRYAERIVAAWSTADTEVPAVAEMRALLARLPQQPTPAE